jgi:polygalacturonase
MLLNAALLLLLSLSSIAYALPAFNVLQYGAAGNGHTLDSPAIQRAIDAASIHGGTVIVPAGTYLSGSIFVKSGVTLEIQSGATILGSQRIADYPMMPTRIAGIEMSWPAALVNVYGQRNVVISGEGTIDGDGKIFWDAYWTLRKSYEPRGLRWAADYDARRPRLIQVFQSEQVKINQLMLRRAGFWTVHICYSHDVAIDNITIRNNEDGHGPSTDGIDIDSSRNILVSHADIAVNDDALCLKAGRDSDGLRVARPTENVVIRDSIVRAGAAGVTFGSETSGGFRHIEASGIRVLGPVPVGILFKSAHTRGGFGEDITLHDFTLENVAVAVRINMNWNPSYSYATIPPGSTHYPPYWTVLATPVAEGQGRAHFHDVRISRIRGTAKTAFEVAGYPSLPLDQFTLSDFDLQTQTAGHIADARDWSFSNVILKTADGSKVSLADSERVTGLATVPAVELPQPDPAERPFAKQDQN